MSRKKKINRFPPGWDEERVQKVIAHYEEQTETEAIAEDEEICTSPTSIPTEKEKNRKPN